MAEDFRVLRFRRRVVSARWLVEDAREKAGLDPRSRDGFAEPLRPAKCGHALGPMVTVNGVPGSGRARFVGLLSCGSIWACPCCSSLIRQGRASEVEVGTELWEKRYKGSFLFVTFTLRHKRQDRLKDSLDTLTEAFSATIRGNPWKRFAGRLGIVGQVKATEITWSRSNGWHAHLHVLFFLRSVPSVDAIADADGWLSARWQSMVVKRGGRVPNLRHGVDVRKVTDRQVVGLYITKLQEAKPTAKKRFPVAQELTRIDTKRGRLQSLVPFDLLDLDGLGVEEVQERRELWLEYVTATRGKRAIVWSRSLKELLEVPEVSDDELLEGEAEDEDTVLWAIRRKDWRRIQSDADALVQLLEAVEEERWDLAERVVPCDVGWLEWHNSV